MIEFKFKLQKKEDFFSLPLNMALSIVNYLDALILRTGFTIPFKQLISLIGRYIGSE